MTLKEFRKALDLCVKVYGYVELAKGNGLYVQLEKAHLVARLNFLEGEDIKAVLSNETYLYIN